MWLWCDVVTPEIFFINGEKNKRENCYWPFPNCSYKNTLFFFSAPLFYILLNILPKSKRKKHNTLVLWKKEQYVNGDIPTSIHFPFGAKQKWVTDSSEQNEAPSLYPSGPSGMQQTDSRFPPSLMTVRTGQSESLLLFGQEFMDTSLLLLLLSHFSRLWPYVIP